MTSYENEETPMLNEANALEMISIYNRDIEKSKELKKLQENKSFQSLVMDSYFKEECVRLTSLLAISPQGDRPRIIDDLYAISAFSAYLSSIERNAEQASMNKSAIQEALAEIKDGE